MVGVKVALQPAIVLCVEKEEINLHVLESTLSANSYAILTARNGRQAIEMAKAHQLEAVVIGDDMPDIRVPEIAKKIKKIRPKIAVVIFSGDGDAPHPTVPGVDAMLHKNESVNALIGVLHRLMHRDGPVPFAARRFPRYPVEWTLSVVSDHSGKLETFEGMSTTVSEGGIGGTINGTLQIGEKVLLHIARQPGITVQTRRAEVRYQHNGSYGFAFLDFPVGEQLYSYQPGISLDNQQNC